MKCISFWPKWDVHFSQNEMWFITSRPGWNGHLISARMKWSFHFGQMRWPFHSGQNEMFISARMKWNSFHFSQNEMVISFRPEWNGHFISNKMRWPLHSDQNDMNAISSWPKWDVYFGHNEMKFISFRPEWNGHLNSAEMKCHFFDSLKKYAGRTGQVRTGLELNMNLRMEFDSSVGPTCFNLLIFWSKFSWTGRNLCPKKSESKFN